MSRLTARKSDRVGRNSARSNRRGKAKRKQGKSQAAKNLSKIWFGGRLPWRSLGILVTVLIISAGFLNIWSSGKIVDGIEDMRLAALDASVGAGLAIDEIYVEGRNRAPSHELLSALGLSRGDPILDVDAGAAKVRLEAVGWVSSATVERRLPDTLYVRIRERQPTALWQLDGKLRVVDMSGAVITGTDVGRYAHLPHIVGEGAPEQLPGLLRALVIEPELSQRISAAVWVGDRRWTLRFDDRVDVKMPEGALTDAWRRLSALQKNERVLDSDIIVLDLRQSDRVAVRLHPDAEIVENGGSDA